MIHFVKVFDNNDSLFEGAIFQLTTEELKEELKKNILKIFTKIKRLCT